MAPKYKTKKVYTLNVRIEKVILSCFQLSMLFSHRTTGQDIFKEEEGSHISYVIIVIQKQHASLVVDVTFATFRFRSPLTIISLSIFLYNLIIQQNG